MNTDTGKHKDKTVALKGKKSMEKIPELTFADADRILKHVMESCGRKPVPLKKAIEMLEKDRLAYEEHHIREG